MAKLNFMLGAMFIVLSTGGCLEQDSELSSDDGGGTYIADCDRHLKKVEEKNGVQYWSLSNIGCMLYKGGGVDKPASLPTIRKQFLYFKEGDNKSPTKCDLKEDSKKLYAACEGEKEPFFLGRIKSGGTVEINTYYAFNIITWEKDHFRRWSHKADGTEALAKQTEIGFTKQRQAPKQ